MSRSHSPTRAPVLRRGLFAALLAALVAGGACAGGGGDAKGAGDGEAAIDTTSSTVATSTTTSAPGTATTASPAATVPPTTAEAAPEPGPGLVPPPAPFATVVVGPAPTDPAELARLADDLVAAETALRDPATPDEALPGLARRQQIAYRSIAVRPEALPPVLERVPAHLRPVVEANVTAGIELLALVGEPRTELPPWRIMAPPPAAELRAHYQEAEERYGVPWEYLAAVHLVESRMGRIRGTSTAGAQGPMQFLPSTWERWGEGGDINDPRDSILAAGRYLQASGAPADMDRALYAYNHSDLYVRAVTHYARQMEAEPRAYLAYYHWQVFYVTVRGDILLEEGYVG